jgi:peptidoglycan/xylan/chitin deacetylase (PgdA/CDA1 family)
MWNVTGHDWKATTPEFIEQKVAPRIRGGAVILLHDGGHAAFGTDRSPTVTAVDDLLTDHKAAGYSFVTIPQMMSSLP